MGKENSPTNDGIINQRGAEEGFWPNTENLHQTAYGQTDLPIWLGILPGSGRQKHHVHGSSSYSQLSMHVRSSLFFLSFPECDGSFLSIQYIPCYPFKTAYLAIILKKDYTSGTYLRMIMVIRTESDQSVWTTNPLPLTESPRNLHWILILPHCSMKRARSFFLVASELGMKCLTSLDS